MFSGLVLGKAKVLEVVAHLASRRIRVQSDFPELENQKLGASIAVNGVCLSVVKIEKRNDSVRIFDFEISPETLQCSNLSQLSANSLVHLEPSLKMGDELGGHLVSGHVDALCTLVEVQVVEAYRKLRFQVDKSGLIDVSYYLVPKASVALDGVSLTVNKVEDIGADTFFEVMLIPHTLENTCFESLSLGSQVNVEADMMAKYLARYHQVLAKVNV